MTYGLDVPLAAASLARGREAHALVVADTRGDLPFARDEGAWVAEALAKKMKNTELEGRAATGPALHDALAQATSLHYAGHAIELEGDLVLPLAAGGRLTTTDILALPASPERVILSACAAGRLDANGLGSGMGFVQAFAERGAHEVVAPSRPVRDDLALAFARALVATGGGDSHRALGELRRAHPDGDWSAYRIWGR